MGHGRAAGRVHGGGRAHAHERVDAASAGAPSATGVPAVVEAVVVDPDEWAAGWRRS